MDEEENEEVDPMQQLFFGKMVTEINFKDNGEDQTRKNHDQMSDIIVNVSEQKDILAVWENDYQQTIDNFELNDGVRVPAEKVDWVEQLPEVLTI